MNIIKGKQKTAQRVVIYGPEGIGKSTIASQFPRPVFIDTEGSTSQLDVARLERPTSWGHLSQQVKHLRANPSGFATVVIDTADWAERLCEEAIIAEGNNPKINSIEDFGYGKGFTKSAEKFGKLLNFLNDMQSDGWNVVLLAHSQMRKFEQPDETGAYDRYELKMGKKVCALVKEWADAILFCNYKIFVVDVEGKKKGQGGQRVIYTQHHACWDAKNRWGLPEEVKMSFDSFAEHIPAMLPSGGSQSQSSSPKEDEDDIPMDYEEKEREAIDNPEVTAPQKTGTRIPEDNPAGFPTKLWSLMKDSGVDEADVRKAVAHKGYYPEETPIDRYDDKFVEGGLIANWDTVLNTIKELKNG